jgi:DNA-directed RNA polymerase specialized sigma24 family protein
MYEMVSSQCQEFGEAMDLEMITLKKCMMKLPDRYKQYLLMRYEASLSYRAIAEKAHISMQAVYKTFCKIHSCLAQCVHLSLDAEDQK